MESGESFTGIALATAHPAKFKPLVEEVIGRPVDVPERLAVMANQTKHSIEIDKDYESFKEAFLQAV
jgi:threonine synthase